MTDFSDEIPLSWAINLVSSRKNTSKEAALSQLRQALAAETLNKAVGAPFPGAPREDVPSEWWEIGDIGDDKITMPGGQQTLLFIKLSRSELLNWLSAVSIDNKDRQCVSFVKSVHVTHISDEHNCQSWLEELMKQNVRSLKNKDEYRKEAIDKFNIGSRAFDRAWAHAISNTNSDRGKSGAKPKKQ